MIFLFQLSNYRRPILSRLFYFIVHGTLGPFMSRFEFGASNLFSRYLVYLFDWVFKSFRIKFCLVLVFLFIYIYPNCYFVFRQMSWCVVSCRISRANIYLRQMPFFLFLINFFICFIVMFRILNILYLIMFISKYCLIFVSLCFFLLRVYYIFLFYMLF